MFEDKCVWSALYPISNHSHIRQLQFATHAFSQQVLQQAVQGNFRPPVDANASYPSVSGNYVFQLQRLLYCRIA